MTKPDYPSLSAKLVEHSQELCSKCGLTVLRGKDQPKPCQSDCPSRLMLQSATLILKDLVQI